MYDGLHIEVWLLRGGLSQRPQPGPMGNSKVKVGVVVVCMGDLRSS